jgi:RHO1 GDP-GTP exchange protein 1/2
VAFHPPYILLFSSTWIEIWHVEDGKLVQVMPGKDMLCSWDGRGVVDSLQTNADLEWLNVHAIRNASQSDFGSEALQLVALVPKIR